MSLWRSVIGEEGHAMYRLRVLILAVATVAGAALGTGPTALAAAQNPPPTQPPKPPPTTTAPPAAVVPAERTPAQDAAEAKLGRGVTNQEIVDVIRRSGMSQ